VFGIISPREFKERPNGVDENVPPVYAPTPPVKETGIGTLELLQ
jgi:hypothetical protein